MKQLKRIFPIVAMTLLLIIVSCSKDSIRPVGFDRMSECHAGTAWDSTKLTNALIGEWEWEYLSCYSGDDEGDNSIYQGLVIEFKSDYTLEVSENGVVTQNSTWEWKEGAVYYTGVKATPSVGQLYGVMLFCGGRVEFRGSYTDVCDNIFKRI
ncbi:MAG: hypothetical protein ACPGXL_06900 [Chitinophagales bacterium]